MCRSASTLVGIPLYRRRIEEIEAELYREYGEDH